MLLAGDKTDPFSVQPAWDEDALPLKKRKKCIV